MRDLKTLCACLLLLLVAACGTGREASYDIIAPETEAGRQCAQQCVAAKTSCEQTCQSQTSNCEQLNTIEQQSKYLIYSGIQAQRGLPLDKSSDDFSGSRICSLKTCMQSCAENHRLCHVNCGGRVVRQGW